jgi:hypothetical protein
MRLLATLLKGGSGRGGRVRSSAAQETVNMRKKAIDKNLRKALLEEGSFAQALFEYELEEHIQEYIQSKRADRDKFFLAITEHSNDVAMLLIDEADNVHINEAARELLKQLWRGAYKKNLQTMIPGMADTLAAGYLYAAGVKVVDSVYAGMN